MYFGADYYPEHWPKERWPVDAKMMREADLNVVRLAEFAWSKIEPKRGMFDFDWLDEAIGILEREGIRVIMGTPTATPPKWLMDEHPDIYPKDYMGHVRGFGSRRHYCYNNPTYRRETKRIVKLLAERYKNHPSVIAWQIDNEFGCHNTTRCYCEHCLKAFQEWLKAKYGTIEKLNREWGTIFWSQTYGDWSELILPGYSVCHAPEQISGIAHVHNPGLMLDFYRFSSESVVSYQRAQIDELKAVGCQQPITHNLCLRYDIDFFDLGKDLDFISWDNYPSDKGYLDTSIVHDRMRGAKNKNFWIMEQQSGPCGWNVLGDTPKPGQLRLWTYQSIAHGADAIVYFRWRACTFGTEEYWYGILDHDAVPRRRYYEIQQTGKELKKLSDLLEGAEVVSEAAIITTFDNLWSHQIQPHNKNFNYNSLLFDYYRGLAHNHFTTDITGPEVDFGKYKVVFLPAFNLGHEGVIGKAEEYVKQGGTLVITFRSGTKTRNNAMSTMTLPGSFRDIAGIQVEEFDSLNNGRFVTVEGEGFEGMASIWCDILKPEGARVLARYTGDYYRGKPAVTVNEYGSGKVYYIGCDLDETGMMKLVRGIMEEAGVKPALPNPTEGVEAIKRRKEKTMYLMVMNHKGNPVDIRTEGSCMELITEKQAGPVFTLEPYGVALLQQ